MKRFVLAMVVVVAMATAATGTVLYQQLSDYTTVGNNSPQSFFDPLNLPPTINPILMLTGDLYTLVLAGTFSQDDLNGNQAIVTLGGNTVGDTGPLLQHLSGNPLNFRLQFEFVCSQGWTGTSVTLKSSGFFAYGDTIGGGDNGSRTNYFTPTTLTLTGSSAIVLDAIGTFQTTATAVTTIRGTLIKS